MKKKLLFGLVIMSALITNQSKAQTASVQVIHNCPDAAASVVDIYAGSTLLLNDVAFRSASGFLTVPANVNIRLGIAPSTSTSVADTLFGLTINLAANETYVAIANGIVIPTGYNPTPAFNLDVFATGRTIASNAANTDVLVYHGSTDAPVVDIVAPFTATLVNDIAYSEFSTDYLELPTADYKIQVRNQEGTDVVAEYSAPLSTLNLDGQALVVVASGFLNPANNNNGPSFGLYAVPSSGGAFVQLPATTISTTRVQAIHNCADLAAATVDVYLNNTLLINDFDFREATPFIDAPAGTDFRLVICPPNSMDTMSKIVGYTYNLSPSSKYILVANGIVSGTGYSPVKPFDISVFAGAREKSSQTNNTDVLVFHGCTDAPIVDVVETTAGILSDNLDYGDFDGYLELPVANYEISITDASGVTTVATYDAPLATLSLQNNAITVLASGFLDPTMNSNGEEFGLYVALSSGGSLIPLPLSTTLSTERIEENYINIYPNPVVDRLFIEGAEQLNTNYTIYSANGSLVLQGNVNGNSIDVSNLESGFYLIQIFQDGKFMQTKFTK
jgi:hypothetical protein